MKKLLLTMFVSMSLVASPSFASEDPAPETTSDWIKLLTVCPISCKPVQN